MEILCNKTETPLVMLETSLVTSCCWGCPGTGRFILRSAADGLR